MSKEEFDKICDGVEVVDMLEHYSQYVTAETMTKILQLVKKDIEKKVNLHE